MKAVLLCLLLATALPVVAQTNDSPAVTNALASGPHTNRPAAQISPAERQKLIALNKDIKAAFDEKNYGGAKEKLRELIQLQPKNATHWYNLACAQSRLGEKTDAIQSIEKSIELGWADFHHLERDNDLDNLRQEPGYLAITARKDKIQRERAEKIQAELQRQYGKDTLYHIDDSHRLIFATTIDQSALDELRATLEGYADALQRDLFEYKPERYVSIIVPKTWTGGMIGGLYNNLTGVLLSKAIGDEMIHEFTHALHHGDQSARGQQHPIWITEGLATLVENSELEKGRIVPVHNHRLNSILARVKVNRHMPWPKFMAQTQPEFLKQSSYNYAQARYMVFYLQDQGKLSQWYQNYVTGYASDTNGLAAWETTFGKPLAEIESDWVRWMLTLSNVPIRLKEGDPSLGLSLQPGPEGLTITRLAPDGGAAQAGLKTRDLITHAAGSRVTSHQDLVEILMKHKVGDKLPLKYRRGTEYADVEVVLTPAPSPYRKAASPKLEANPAKTTAAK